jgi:chemotaxis protein methyltransferase CheR
MEPQPPEIVELDLLLEAIFRRYGYDFRDYSRSSILRRLKQFMTLEQIDSVADLIAPTLRDRVFAFQLIKRFSISVSELFRDPPVYRSLVKHVFPALQSYPSFKVWHAGCANGQEVYSLAILLREANLLERSTLFATDINSKALETAKTGIYPIRDMKKASKNYQESGGQASFSDYFHTAYDAVTMANELKKRITFAEHNLVQDASFGEMHLILCRNVFLYFNTSLRERAFNLLTESLANGGIICLGTAETLPDTNLSAHFEVIDPDCKIYRKHGFS